MELLQVLVTLVVVVSGMLLLGVLLLIDRNRLYATRRDIRERIRIALPFVLVLGVVLLINAQFRRVFSDVSQVIGFHVTHTIFRIEGTFVVYFQRIFGEQFAAYFSFMYIYGYVFLLVFPLIAYFVLERMESFKAITIAYTANYGIGVLCYTLFIAFGPRNLIADALYIGTPMYDQYSHLNLITSEANENTNVFPSLHTSLSATVMLFAWKTRGAYPRWFLIAWFTGVSIIIATMYLGIHWFIDVVAGLGLAALSYWIGYAVVERELVSQLEVRKQWRRLVSTFR